MQVFHRWTLQWHYHKAKTRDKHITPETCPGNESFESDWLKRMLSMLCIHMRPQQLTFFFVIFIYSLFPLIAHYLHVSFGVLLPPTVHQWGIMWNHHAARGCIFVHVNTQREATLETFTFAFLLNRAAGRHYTHTFHLFICPSLNKVVSAAKYSE